MILLYAHGEHALYRKLVLANQCVFTTGCALFSALGISLYEGLGSFAAAFRFAAGISTIVGVLFGAFFGRRLAHTTQGVLGSLASAEAELRAGAAAAPGARHRDALSHQVVQLQVDAPPPAPGDAVVSGESSP